MSPSCSSRLTRSGPSSARLVVVSSSLARPSASSSTSSTAAVARLGLVGRLVHVRVQLGAHLVPPLFGSFGSFGSAGSIGAVGSVRASCSAGSGSPGLPWPCCAGRGSASSAAAAGRAGGRPRAAPRPSASSAVTTPCLAALALVAVLLRLEGGRAGRRVVADHVELLAHRPQVRGGPVEEHADRERDAAEAEGHRQDVEQHLLLLGVRARSARRPACSCSSAGAGW